METPLLIAADKIGMTYPQGLHALAEVSLTIADGEFVSLVGPSGCGKSTFLRLVAGLQTPTAGRLQVRGLLPAAARGGAVPTAFVFQDATLLPWRTVEQNVRLPLELVGRDGGLQGGREAASVPASPSPCPLPGGEGSARVAEVLKLVGLGDFAGSFPRQLSGGMKMRASLARALVTDPALMLLDEPFGALDDLSRGQLNEELHSLWRQKRWTALFVTHNIVEAAFLSTRIVVISARPGRVIADLPVPFGESRNAQLKASAEFAKFTGEVAQLLREGGQR